jgi:hypothetical protein
MAGQHEGHTDKLVSYIPAEAFDAAGAGRHFVAGEFAYELTPD